MTIAALILSNSLAVEFVLFSILPAPSCMADSKSLPNYQRANTYGRHSGCCQRITRTEPGLLGKCFHSNNLIFSGEIDILEARGQEPTIIQSTLHHGGVWPNNVYTTTGKLDMKVDLSAGYHIYAAEWEETQIRFYFDTTLVYTMALSRYPIKKFQENYVKKIMGNEKNN
jgi:hypothetical protein